MEGPLELVIGEARGEAVRDAEAAGVIGRAPLRAADPRERLDLAERLFEEALRVRLGLGELCDAAHPELEGHAHREEVAREVGAQPPETAQRVPQHGEREERPAEPQHRERDGGEVAIVRVAHERDRSQHQHHAELEYEHRVEEIEHLSRVRLLRGQGQHAEEEEHQGQAHEAELRERLGNGLVRQQERGHRAQQQDREHVGERHEIEAVALRRLHREDAPAEDAEEDQQPRDDDPAREEVERGRDDREEHQAREDLELALRGDEGLPQEEETKVHQQPDALELASGRRDERHVQREQHREHHPAPVGGDAGGEALRCGAGEEGHRVQRREADTRCRNGGQVGGARTARQVQRKPNYTKKQYLIAGGTALALSSPSHQG